jgi:hypothetical protein
MAETTADVRRDIEMTRERMSQTIAQLENKINVMQVVRDHPWPAIGAAAAAGFLLSGSHADVKAAHAVGGTVAVTKSTGSRLGPMLDDLLGKVMLGVQDVLQQKADELVHDLRRALGAPEGSRPAQGGHTASGAMSHGMSGGGMASGASAGGSTGGATGAHGLADLSHASGPGTGSATGSSEPWAPTTPASGSSGAAYGGEQRTSGESGTGPAYGSSSGTGSLPRAD